MNPSAQTAASSAPRARSHLALALPRALPCVRNACTPCTAQVFPFPVPGGRPQFHRRTLIARAG